MLKITAEEVNFLVYQYLQESDYKHTAFAFQFESNVHKSSYNESQLPSGMLLMFLEKALLLLEMETHLDKDDELIVCNQPFTLLNPHICSYKSISIDPEKTPLEDPTKKLSPFISTLKNSTIAQGIPSEPPTTTAVQAGVSIDLHKKQSSTPQTAGDVQPMKVDIPKKQDLLEETKKTVSASNIEQPIHSTNSRGVRYLEGHTGLIYGLAWHPNKKLLASAGMDSTARLWKIDESDKKQDPHVIETSQSGKEQRKPKQFAVLPHVNEETTVGAKAIDVTSLSWSTSKAQLATGASDGIVRIWDEEGMEIFTIV